MAIYYTVTWATTQSHRAILPADMLAALLGVTEADLAADQLTEIWDLGRGLGDGLGAVQTADSYAGMTTRELEHDGITRDGQTPA